MGGIYQRIIVSRIFTLCYLHNFFVNTVHRINESIQFGKAFAFGGLDHKCAVNGKRKGGSMVTVIHESFGNVGFGNARKFF